MTNTWIIVADDARIANLVSTARAIGGELTAAVIGSRELAQEVAAGVDRAVWLGDTGEAPAESLAVQATRLVEQARPDVVLGAARDAERVLLGAIAAGLKAPLLTMPREITVADGVVTVSHAIFGGIAEETVAVHGTVAVMLDGGGSLPAGQGVVEEAVAVVPATMKVLATSAADTAQVDLGRAKRIVSVGRGLRSQEDLSLIEQLATALGAEVACSRPIAEALGWLSTDRYIGVTGQHVAPQLYVAVGISGQLQHVVGSRAAGTVVVVNSDENAPYFAEADYGIVGNLYDVVPALIAALG